MPTFPADNNNFSFIILKEKKRRSSEVLSTTPSPQHTSPFVHFQFGLKSPPLLLLLLLLRNTCAQLGIAVSWRIINLRFLDTYDEFTSTRTRSTRPIVDNRGRQRAAEGRRPQPRDNSLNKDMRECRQFGHYQPTTPEIECPAWLRSTLSASSQL